MDSNFKLDYLISSGTNDPDRTLTTLEFWTLISHRN
jgi:hypothetical protein